MIIGIYLVFVTIKNDFLLKLKSFSIKSNFFGIPEISESCNVCIKESFYNYHNKKLNIKF